MAEPTTRYSKEQKIGIVLLSSFVLLAVTLGLIQMRNTLYKPFALNNSIPPMLGQEVNTVDALRYRDTDMDGLTDYDELYVYLTSPYLADSDSDGITDKQELESGKNPNCAEGKDCMASYIDEGTSLQPKADVPALFDISAMSVEDFLTQPAQMRESLLQSGMDKALVDQLTDEELTAIGQEMFASTTIMNQLGALATTSSEQSTADQLILEMLNAQQ
jgi:hypothetical protein